MGQVVVTEFVSVDGVAQAPGGPDEDRDGGFELGGWQAPLVDEEIGTAMVRRAMQLDAVLLGRRTYDLFSHYWPDAPEENPFAGILNGAPKYVASRSLEPPLSWQNSDLLGADLASAVGDLKQRHEQIHVIGSLDLVQSLLAERLVDRLDLLVFPVLLGSGKRVFEAGATSSALQLVESTPYANGAQLLSYAPTGPAQVGTMG